MAAGIPFAAGLGSADDAPPVDDSLLALDCQPGDRIVEADVLGAEPGPEAPDSPREALGPFLKTHLPEVAPDQVADGQATAEDANFSYSEGEDLLAVVTVEGEGSRWRGTSYVACYSLVNGSASDAGGDG